MSNIVRMIKFIEDMYAKYYEMEYDYVESAVREGRRVFQDEEDDQPTLEEAMEQMIDDCDMTYDRLGMLLDLQYIDHRDNEYVNRNNEIVSFFAKDRNYMKNCMEAIRIVLPDSKLAEIIVSNMERDSQRQKERFRSKVGKALSFFEYLKIPGNLTTSGQEDEIEADKERCYVLLRQI